MSADRPDVVVFVAGGDEYADRMTRSLGRELEGLDGVSVAYRYQGADEPRSGAKGPGTLDFLRFALDWAWPVGAPLVAEKIRRWCSRSAKETVTVEVGEVEIRISGELTPEQVVRLEGELGKHGQ